MYKDTARREYKFLKKSTKAGTTYEITVEAYDKTIEVTEEVYKTLTDSYWRIDRKDSRNYKSFLSLDYIYANSVDNVESKTLYDFLDSNTYNPEVKCLKKEINNSLVHALEKLNDSEQELITNIIINNMSIREYAEKIDCSPSTVHYRLKKAKKNLKKFFISLDK